MSQAAENSRTRLLTATIDLVRSNGYAATRVEDVCAAAGVTKGSFFHHFESKEDLAIAAAAQWNDRAARLFATAPFTNETDALSRLLGYVNFRKRLLDGEIWQWSCYAGTTIQETHETYPAIRDACAISISNHVAMLKAMIEEVLRDYPVASMDAESLATHIQAVLQGAFIMAKARQESRAAQDSIDHLYRYLLLLFASAQKRKR
jgi:TetR/AcrR family transcriptional repressor of nem operon